MLGIYFSGTGNTRYCVEQFVKKSDEASLAISIEDTQVINAIKSNKLIVFGYPIYFSNLPKIVRDFIENNKEVFKNKDIYIISTMGLFSGDGAGCSARLFKKYGANIVGGLHLKMPDCIGDEKLLKKSKEENMKLIQEAVIKIENAVNKFKEGNPTKEGLNIMYHLAGLFGQRLWFYNKTKEYSNKVRINENKCISCGKCVKVCPMNNLYLSNGKI
ncbi:MAG: EFR1 family ferrodoxin, partial [Clostridium sp.]